MASRYRFSLEIDDIRDRIENLYSTVWWREMSLAAKIRTLVIERIEQSCQNAKKRLTRKPVVFQSLNPEVN
jgi:hypothetical protein